MAVPGGGKVGILGHQVTERSNAVIMGGILKGTQLEREE